MLVEPGTLAPVAHCAPTAEQTPPGDGDQPAAPLPSSDRLLPNPSQPDPQVAPRGAAARTGRPVDPSRPGPSIRQTGTRGQTDMLAPMPPVPADEYASAAVRRAIRRRRPTAGPRTAPSGGSRCWS